LIAASSTGLLLLIGYPIAYGMARAPRSWQAILSCWFVLPFWTSFLIRIYAWINILQREGLLNQLLLALGIVEEPPSWLASDTAIYIGIVYSYLPFMVLPIYAMLEKLPETLLEAAADLGCPRWKAFWLVTLPLSLPGVIAGSLLCFIPIVGEFVIPDLLGGSDAMMIGQTFVDRVLQQTGDWPASLRGGGGAARPPGGADRDLSAPADAPVRRRPLIMRKASWFNVASVALGLVFLYLPNRRPGDLFLQRLAARRHMGRLVDALVRGAPRRSRHGGLPLGSAADCHRIGERCDRAGNARGDRIGAGRPLSPPASCSAGWSMRRW